MSVEKKRIATSIQPLSVTKVQVDPLPIRLCMTDKRLMRLVGRRARELRIAKGLKQEDMCRFGFEYKYYQRIEYGEKNVTLRTLDKLARAFGVPVSELFRFD